MRLLRMVPALMAVLLAALCLAACGSPPKIDRVDVTWSSLSPAPRWGLYPGSRQEIEFRPLSAYTVNMLSGGKIVTSGTVGDTGTNLAFLPAAGATPRPRGPRTWTRSWCTCRPTRPLPATHNGQGPAEMIRRPFSSAASAPARAPSSLSFSRKSWKPWAGSAQGLVLHLGLMLNRNFFDPSAPEGIPRGRTLDNDNSSGNKPLH